MPVPKPSTRPSLKFSLPPDELKAMLRDLEAARVELRQVLGYPAEPDAVGTVKPK